MRRPRSSTSRAIISVALLGASALLGGCTGSNDAQSDGAATDIDTREQMLLQERIQQGIAEPPVKSPR
jgi:hypothetical protein